VHSINDKKNKKYRMRVRPPVFQRARVVTVCSRTYRTLRIENSRGGDLRSRTVDDENVLIIRVDSLSLLDK